MYALVSFIFLLGIFYYFVSILFPLIPNYKQISELYISRV